MRIVILLVFLSATYSMSSADFFEKLELVKNVKSFRSSEYIKLNESKLYKDPEFTVLYLNHAFTKVMSDLDDGKTSQFRQGSLPESYKYTNFNEYVVHRFGKGESVRISV